MRLCFAILTAGLIFAQSAGRVTGTVVDSSGDATRQLGSKTVNRPARLMTRLATRSLVRAPYSSHDAPR